MNGNTGSEQLKLFGFNEEKMNITYKCEECDNCGEAAVSDAPECSSHGDLVCGGCKCKDGWKGNNFLSFISNIFEILSLLAKLITETLQSTL